jgi:hypothetical protein
MFIENQPKQHSSPVRGGMFGIDRTAILKMEDAAPNGALKLFVLFYKHAAPTALRI